MYVYLPLHTFIISLISLCQCYLLKIPFNYYSQLYYKSLSYISLVQNTILSAVYHIEFHRNLLQFIYKPLEVRIST